MVKIEIVYIPEDQNPIQLYCSVADKATVADALECSGIYQSHPETRHLNVGIFSKPVRMDSLLKPGDRIEIYRSLTLDPKEKRRQRAVK